MEYKREVFPNAPLAFVTCEIRFPLAPRLVHDESIEALAEALADTLPVRVHENYRVSIQSGDEQPVESDLNRFRFLNKARTTSVAVTQDSLSVETTDYDEWRNFKAIVLQAIEAVEDMTRIAGVERIGLRYIDEIRVPEEFGDVSGWRGWISDDVLGHLDVLAGYSPESSQRIVQLIGPTGQLTIRYAALSGGGVISDGPLKRLTPATEGPFFVIDTDSHRYTPDEEMLNFSIDTLSPILDDLHEPAGTVFYRAVTDKTRQHFRRGK